MITPSRPRRLIRRGQQGLDFRPREIANQLVVFTLHRNGQDPCDNPEAVRVTQSHQAEKRRMAAERILRERTELPRCCSRYVEKAEHGGGIDIGNPQR